MSGLGGRRRKRALAGAVLVLLVLGCAGPYYERAAITEGYSGGVGIGITAGDRLAQQYRDMDAPTVTIRDVSGLGTACVRYGWSNSAAFFLQATAGRGAWDHEGVIQGAEDLNGQLTDIQLGVKFRVGSSGAVKAGLGWPGLLDVLYLHDLGRPLTAGIGLGMRGLSFALTHHLDISSRVVQHASLTFTAYPPSFVEFHRPSLFGAFLGVGWELIEPQSEDADGILPGF